MQRQCVSSFSEKVAHAKTRVSAEKIGYLARPDGANLGVALLKWVKGNDFGACIRAMKGNEIHWSRAVKKTRHRTVGIKFILTGSYSDVHGIE